MTDLSTEWRSTVGIDQQGARWAYNLGRHWAGATGSTRHLCIFPPSTHHHRYWMAGYRDLPFLWPPETLVYQLGRMGRHEGE